MQSSEVDASDGGPAGDDAGSEVVAGDDTCAEIMRSTYRALAGHGYAELTVQRIAAEFEKSKSLLYYYYDGKDDLLLEFLDRVLDRFEADAAVDGDDGSRERLDALLEWAIPRSLDDDRAALVGAFVELRAQAINDPDYRTRFARHDRLLRERFARTVRAGVDDGTFRAVDPDAAAELLLSTVSGAMTRRVSTDGIDARRLRGEVDRYVEALLVAEKDSDKDSDASADADASVDPARGDDATAGDGENR